MFCLNTGGSYCGSKQTSQYENLLDNSKKKRKNNNNNMNTNANSQNPLGNFNV